MVFGRRDWYHRAMLGAARSPLLLGSSAAVLALGLAGCLREAPSAAPEATRTDLAAAASQPNTSDGHFYVQGRHLYDRCGERVVLRGINEMVIWTAREGETFGEIARTGANTVRIVWTVADHPGEARLDRVLRRALDARLIPIIELHDATGKLDKVPELVDFWTRPAVVEVLKRHQASLLLNIANEAGGTGVRAQEFADVYRPAVARLRRAGLVMPLIIDAPDWGKDIDVLQEVAPSLIADDPEHDLLFSVHMWWVKSASSDDPGSTKRIARELAESEALGLPLLVGEFGHAGVGCTRFIDYKTILAETDKRGVGWLAWSWGPGNKDCEEMDMTTDGRFASLRGWGLDVAVTDPHGILRTSKIPASMARGRCAGGTQ